MGETTKAGGTAGTQSVQRAIAVLRHVASMPHATRLVDIAEALAIDVTTAHRIVQGLRFEGMLQRDGATRRYRIGRVMHELSLAASVSFPLRERCRSTLERLALRSGDSVFLMARSGWEFVCLEHVAGSFPIQTHTLDAGARRPLGAGAGGMALLMALPEAEAAAALAANEARYAAWPRLTTQRVRERLAASRRAGYAINDEDLMPGVAAVGVAFDAGKAVDPGAGAGVGAGVGATTPLAAISVASISARMQPARRAELARELRSELRRLAPRLRG